MKIRLLALIGILSSCSRVTEDGTSISSSDDIQGIIQEAGAQITEGDAITGIAILDSLIIVGYSEYEIWNTLGMGYRFGSTDQLPDRTRPSYFTFIESKIAKIHFKRKYTAYARCQDHDSR